ncbi:hypothetical protein [Microvirga sp. Mcv34]|uniref:hypothetical protein n=1 Tax=Microvirga sp. Mcv34 TaxID=2926016 RepID=UPI0021C91D56|nr:hypothetical protein [Microvirga sp. Mcv34]
MTPEEYEAALAQVGLKPGGETSRFFGVTDRTERRWRSAGPSPEAALVLRIMCEFKISAAEVLERLDPPPAAPESEEDAG